MHTQDKTKYQALICGYFGENNLGDDVLLNILLNSLPDQIQPVVTFGTSSPLDYLPSNSRFINRKSFFSLLKELAQSRFLIFGGGSLLQDATSIRSIIYYSSIILIAYVLRIPIFLWAQGLGPFRSCFARKLAILSLKLSNSITLRDPQSIDCANKLGFVETVHWQPDPVWQLPSIAWIGGESVCVCFHDNYLLDLNSWRLIIQDLEKYILLESLTIHWLFFDSKNDHKLISFLDRNDILTDNIKIKSRFFPIRSIGEATDLFRMSRIVLSTRLHSLILAQLCGTPSLAISCDPKVSSLSLMAKIPYIDLEKDKICLNNLYSKILKATSIFPDQELIEQLSVQSKKHNQYIYDFLKLKVELLNNND